MQRFATILLSHLSQNFVQIHSEMFYFVFIVSVLLYFYMFTVHKAAKYIGAIEIIVKSGHMEKKKENKEGRLME